MLSCVGVADPADAKVAVVIQMRLPARTGRTGDVLFGGRQRGRECRLPLPEQDTDVGPVLLGPVGFHQ
jgi:hypothetical protein